MIDIHSHVLFGMDDGAQDLDTAIDMCRDAYENGCDVLVLTPHFVDYKNLSDFVEERDHRIRILAEILDKEEIPLKLVAGAEIFLNDKIFSVKSLDALTINKSRYILCEMPLGPFNTDHVLMWFDELIDRGYIPILAHPERYVELHRNYNLMDEILDRPILLQINIDSLRGRNGEAPQYMALDLMNRGFAHFMASDAHDLVYRHTRLAEKFEDLPDDITDEIIETFMRVNPLKVLNNKDII